MYYTKAYRKDGSRVMEGTVSVDHANDILDWYKANAGKTHDSVYGIIFHGDDIHLQMEGNLVYSWVL